MATPELLEQAEEDALHKTRLLNVEEKPFRRVSKRLLAPDSLIAAPARLPLTPPPDATAADEAAAAKQAKTQAQQDAYKQFREDVILDFAAFESSIVRMQFLLASNARERERYAAEKTRIQATAASVRGSTAQLRDRLESAQSTLAVRQSWDELAGRITANKQLKPREEQQASLRRLEGEIAELEGESRTYARTWAERREQFGRILEEGMALRRQIRDEKEEVERREGMEEQEDGDDADGSSSMRGRASAVGTPRPDAGGATPMHTGIESEAGSNSQLTVDKSSLGRRRSPRLAATPDIQVSTPKVDHLEDLTMAEDGEVSADEEAAGSAIGGAQDSEANRRRNAGDQMDTS